MKYMGRQEARTPVSTTKRKYDGARRQAQARQTRLQIAKAARKLFTERGYGGATIEAIAAQAGVAKETVYAIFRNKQRLLTYLLVISVGGDDRPVRILDRPGPQAGLQDTDQRRQLMRFARDVTE